MLLCFLSIRLHKCFFYFFQDPGVILLGGGGGGGLSSTDGDDDEVDEAFGDSDDDSDDSTDSEVDPHRPVSPINFVVVGANEKTGKSSLRSRAGVRHQKVSAPVFPFLVCEIFQSRRLQRYNLS